MKMNYKLILLLAFSILLFTGCSSKDTASSGSDTVEIEYWQYSFDSKVHLMDDLIKQFEEENPGIKIKQTTFPYEQYNQKIAALVPAGKGPDVINLYYGWLPKYVKSGFLQPLPKDDFPQEQIESEYFPFIQTSKLDGEYYSLPTAVRTLALFYNKDLFKKAGLDPEHPPTTWDELIDIGKKLTVRDKNGKLITEGLAWQPEAQLHTWFRDGLLYQAGGKDQSDDYKKILWDDNNAGLEAFKYLVELSTVHKIGEKDFYTDDSTAFKTGKAAMNIDGSFRLGDLKKGAPDLNYGVAPLPSYKEKATPATYWANGITANVDGKKLEASVKFLQFLASDKVMEKWSDEIGELPAKKEVALQDKYVNDPIIGSFVNQLPDGKSHFFIDENVERQYILDAINKVLLKQTSVEGAFAELEEKTQSLFDEYWNQ
ncbi:multiple sugar transport system substrate-binding protein [Bacillus capparidis]|nr:multiple sugar transport system substrate-binding protein [Bacillus capparidis]